MKNVQTIFPEGIDSRIYWSDLNISQEPIQLEYQEKIKMGKYTEATQLLESSNIFYYGSWLINMFKNRLVAIDNYYFDRPYPGYYEKEDSYDTYNNILISSDDNYDESNIWISDGIILHLPYEFNSQKRSVVLNNEIHILGGEKAPTNHYKFNGTSWSEVSTLPYDVSYGSEVIIYNNEIHILGGYLTVNRKKHYKFDGTSWIEVSTLPYVFYNGAAVVYNNEIHILGSDVSGTKHYKFDGTSWSEVSTLPYLFSGLALAVVYNNEIHILGNGYSYSWDDSTHYKFDGTSWSEVSTLPYQFNGSTVVYNNEIHILGGGTIGNTKHYKFDGTSWIEVSTLPYVFNYGAAVVYNNEIHILGGQNNKTAHFVYRNNKWSQVY